MKYIDSEKLIAEIERRQELNVEQFKKGLISVDTLTARDSQLLGLKDFINSLPEDEPSEDLEKAAEEHSKIVFNGLSVIDNIEAFKAGAQWQKEQKPASGNSEKPNDQGNLEKEIEKYYYEHFAFLSNVHIPTLTILSNIAEYFYEQGKKAMKEQMIKEAVDVEVQMTYTDNTALIYIPYKGHSKDKVKIIIVKED